MDPAVEIEMKALSLQKSMNDQIDRGDSDVQQFYSGVTVFVTGGSGFIGKQLIEKLFRSCAIKKMYLLMRVKKTTTIHERLQQILKDPVFNLVYKKNPSFSDRIKPVEGDVTKIRMGINDKQWSQLTEEVHVIYHVAATIKFNAPLREATLTNVRGTREALALARKCSECKSFVYVSTAYTHATKDRSGKELLEQFYPCPVPPDTLIKIAEDVDDNRLNGITENLISGWPNTYTFTKAAAEEMVRTTAEDLPICIVRPPIDLQRVLNLCNEHDVYRLMHYFYCETTGYVVPLFQEDGSNPLVIVLVVAPAYCEPAPGWLDVSTIFGPSGYLLGTLLGALHVFLIDISVKLEVAPVDYVNNVTIVAPWDAAERRSNGDANIPVYNVTIKGAGLNFGRVHVTLVNSAKDICSPRAMWYCGALTTNNDHLYRILTWFLHYIPAYLLDKVCDLLGNKPKNIKSFVKLFKKFDEFSNIYRHFSCNAWDFKNNNVTAMISRMSETDRAIFNCDLSTLDWEDYIRIWSIGIRKYIIKDGLTGTRAAFKRQYIYLTVNYVFLFGIIYLLWKFILFVQILFKI